MYATDSSTARLLSVWTFGVWMLSFNSAADNLSVVHLVAESKLAVPIGNCALPCAACAGLNLTGAENFSNTLLRRHGPGGNPPGPSVRATAQIMTDDQPNNLFAVCAISSP